VTFVSPFHKISNFPSGRTNRFGTGLEKKLRPFSITVSSAIKGVPWTITLFMLAIILPVEMSFYLGSLRLTAYRLVLLIAFIPLLIRLINGNYGKIRLCDVLMGAYVIWAFLAIVVHHGFDQALESGGIYIVEGFGAYLIGRATVCYLRQFHGFVALFTIIVICLSFFTIPEAVFGINVLRPHVAGTVGGRIGLYRAFGSFDHPILYGCFCAAAISLCWYTFIPIGRSSAGRILKLLLVIVSATMSVSSGAITEMIVQIVFITWERITRTLRWRWWIFSGLLAFAYVSVDLLSTRTPMKVFFSYLTFSPGTAYGRLLIWEWGTQLNVAQHPIFGIGFNDWVRPEWAFSSSVDNFWLVVMMTYGLPAFIFLAGAILYLLVKIGRRKITEPAMVRARKAWMISMAGLIVAASTVHYWNVMFVFFCFFIGAGVWLIDSPGQPATLLSLPSKRPAIPSRAIQQSY